MTAVPGGAVADVPPRDVARIYTAAWRARREGITGYRYVSRPTGCLPCSRRNVATARRPSAPTGHAPATPASSERVRSAAKRDAGALELLAHAQVILVEDAGDAVRDRVLIELAVRNLRAIGAGHSFLVFLRDGFPVNVLNQLKAAAGGLPDLPRDSESGRGRRRRARAEPGFFGVVDGGAPLGVEDEDDVAARRELLRTLGYKP